MDEFGDNVPLHPLYDLSSLGACDLHRVDLRRAISIRRADWLSEQTFRLSTPIKVDLWLEADGEPIGSFIRSKPDPLVADVRGRTLYEMIEPPAMWLRSASGMTESPLNPFPLAKFEGVCLYSGDQVIWQTMFHAVTIRDREGQILS